MSERTDKPSHVDGFPAFHVIVEHDGVRKDAGTVLDGWNPHATRDGTAKSVAEHVMQCIDEWKRNA